MSSKHLRRFLGCGYRPSESETNKWQILSSESSVALIQRRSKVNGLHLLKVVKVGCIVVAGNVWNKWRSCW